MTFMVVTYRLQVAWLLGGRWARGLQVGQVAHGVVVRGAKGRAASTSTGARSVSRGRRRCLTRASPYTMCQLRGEILTTRLATDDA